METDQGRTAVRPYDFAMYGSPLNREEIALMITGDSPLIENYVALEAQLQPNGFDLSVGGVARFVLRQAQDEWVGGQDKRVGGQLGVSDADRVLSDTESLPFDAEGWLSLGPGAYLVTFNEVVNLPPDLMALGRPRSSLLRSGVALHTAVWDAGYRGRSQSLLTVQHPGGFRLQRNARVAQLVFFRLAIAPGEGYQGRYQGEGL